MANELTFKIIDMQNAISDFTQGHISEEQLIKQCKAILKDDGGEIASIEFDEPTFDITRV